MSSEAAKVLRPGSAFATASGGGQLPAGGVDAIRVPMLKVYNIEELARQAHLPWCAGSA
jgi:ethylene receptor